MTFALQETEKSQASAYVNAAFLRDSLWVFSLDFGDNRVCNAAVATNETIAVLMHSLSSFSVVLTVVRGG